MGRVEETKEERKRRVSEPISACYEQSTAVVKVPNVERKVVMSIKSLRSFMY